MKTLLMRRFLPQDYETTILFEGVLQLLAREPQHGCLHRVDPSVAIHGGNRFLAGSPIPQWVERSYTGAFIRHSTGLCIRSMTPSAWWPRWSTPRRLGDNLAGSPTQPNTVPSCRQSSIGHQRPNKALLVRGGRSQET